MQGTTLQKLPNPFKMENGKMVSSREEWKIRREEIKKTVLDIGYGGMPPEPDSTEGTFLCRSGTGLRTYLVTVKSGGRVFAFELKLFVPVLENDKKYPVVLDGDGCWTTLSEKAIESFKRRDIIAASFNRCALVRDVEDNSEVLKSPLYQLFPGISSGSIAGWAWGFSRCIDVLEKLPFIDSKNIAITGHSRGGKAVLVAGAADERIAIVNPNCSGAGGCGCWRYRIGSGHTVPESRERNEILSDLLKNFPNWMGRKMMDYRDRETDIPFDQHYLKTLVAPRYFLQTDAQGDFWANPPGSHGTLMAAREVYRFLGAGDHILASCRYGRHAHTSEDYEILAELMDNVRNGKAPAESLLRDPFPETGVIFDWKSP